MKKVRIFLFSFTLILTQMLMGQEDTNRRLEEGIYAAALTPLNADLSCNSQELAEHCLDLLQRGCKGVVLFGTTGEGSSFSLQERVDVIEKVIVAGIDPQKIILANGGANIPETVELAQAALNWKVSALLVMPPTFFKNVPEEGIIAFYREIIQRINDPALPILLYHIPQFSGVPITLKIIERLRSEFPDVVIGIKESEGNLRLAKAIIAAFPGFQVFVGNEREIIEAVHDGASGSICGVANLYPELICSLFEQGKRANSPNPKELDAFFKAMNGHFFIPAFKAVMEKRKGSAWHLLRPPLTPLSPAQADAFSASIR